MKPLFLFILVFLLSTSLFVCSTFGIYKQNHLIVGRNHDFYNKNAWISVNKRGVTKNEFLLLPNESKLTLTSKYGSIAFITNSLGIPSDGMNEALVWVNKIRERPSVNMPVRTTADGNLVDIVRHERRVEFAMEGQRIFNFLRWDAVKEVFGMGKRLMVQL